MAKGRNKKGRLKRGYKLTRRGVMKIRRVRRTRNDGWGIYLLSA